MGAIEISQLPAPSWIEKQTDRVPIRRIGWFSQRLFMRMALGRRWDDRTLEYQRARVALVLHAHAELIKLVERIDRFFPQWDADRTAARGQEWAALSAELQHVARQTVADAAR